VEKGVLKIGLVQMRSEKGAILENLETTSAYIREAARLGVDVLCFPEGSVTGYNDPNKFPEANVSIYGEELKAVDRMTEGLDMTVLAGILEKNPEGKPFITHGVIRHGDLAGYYRKRNIGDDETDCFSVGQDIPLFNHDNFKYGIAICADTRDEELFAEYARRGAQIVFELAAPGLYGEQATRDWEASYKWWEGVCNDTLTGYAKKYGIWIAVATQAGRTSDEDFPGGGYLFAPDGRRVYATEDWQPGAVYLAIDMETGRIEEIK